MKIAPSKNTKRPVTRTHRTLLPLVAVGGSLAAGPGSAIELGDVVVQSRLGQPLRASIAYALAPNEQITSTCVSVASGRSSGGLPGIGRATISITDRAIVVNGQVPLREPMVSTTLVVNCPYTPNLAREYLMFIDPASPAVEPRPRAAATAATPQPATRPAARQTQRRASIARSARYQVQPGDSLSMIAQRIENRPIGLWPAVNALFAANPDAFMDNDPNRLKAGSWLDIPSFDGTTPVLSAAPETAPQPTVYEPYASSEATEPAAIDAPGTVATESLADPATPPATVDTADRTDVVEPAIDEPVVDSTRDATSDLRPGDIILDTDLEGPVTESSSPNVPTAAIDTSTSTEQTVSSWTLWLAGGGMAIIFALLLFGARLRRSFSPSPVGVATDTGRPSAVDTEKVAVMVDDEYDLDDDSPTAENLALDADLIVGTGLEEGTDMEVAEDFGFAAPTEVDIELPFEPEASIPTMQTDIIPPVRTDEHTILESEILPDDDEYDMSVIVDATKMPLSEDITERDLKAVEVEALEAAESTDSYTINRETDFDILEQDYEDEFTATQALNMEIQRVAEELAERMEEDEDGTAEMPLATVTELDVTAQMRRKGDKVTDADATSANEAVTVSMESAEKTAEMPAAGEEDTMEIEGGKVDTSAG